MTPEAWQRVKAIFDVAADLPAADREAWLADHCAGDPALLAEVRSLLVSLDAAGDFIEPPPTPSADDEAFPTGMSIGPYRIVQTIGEGGMGMVYQAVRVDDLYRKLVALKVVRRGLFSDVAIRRFETERHILAHLDHPNIAKLLDGGTTAEGRPYFVMDFIAGTPIDEYCDHEQLTLRERLQLFLTVCSAVQYAHRNFVVHRDIKPQNILVNQDGDIRLLDFGIARLLDPEPDRETPGLDETSGMIHMMTPEYASPEQLRNMAVSTASDTWSLGVLLYAILTGHRPFVFATRSVQDIYETIRDTEPRRPSAVVSLDESTASGRFLTLAAIAADRRIRPDRLARELRGDLDTILLMALRREPERRYASVEQLSGDIERYLTGLPVLAREDTFAYRAGKFMQRHQGAVVAASLAVFALIAGTVTTSWEAHAARVERQRAERRFTDVRRVANSLLFEVHDAIRDLPGSLPARQLIASKALEFFDRLARDASGDRELQRELASAYERVGDLQPPAQARLSYGKALAVRESLAPFDAGARRELIPTFSKLSDLAWSTDDAPAALQFSRRGLSVAESVASAPDATRQDRIRLATGYLDYGYKAHDIASLRRSLTLLEQLIREEPGDQRLLRIQGIAHRRTAEALAAAAQ